ncbi:hydroxysqualene dehydroxylase HpnE [Rhodoferax sp.]|uniref:hydroxysqualene dehydroxylase HpnE n=1 Tax=Rhodoferax sp. TaxID=50421 RepID=UPI002764AF12|nr:hydroxysqualene dehydroxylase HpnE [Rhodoferax sp.]
MNVAIIGAGWAGLAAAVQAVTSGHEVTLFDASRTAGGRARAVPGVLPNGAEVTLDNGQHILIGAYTETLRLMRKVGVNPEQALLRLPLNLRYPDGAGLKLPRWPAPLDALCGILMARGWRLDDKLALLRAAQAWRRAGFMCAPSTTVAQLCTTLTPRVRQEMIEPLCVSALNTPGAEASAQVFLRVLRDALFGVRGGSNLLLPRIDLSQLFPQAALNWLALAKGSAIRLGERVDVIEQRSGKWRLLGHSFDRVVLATSSTDAARIIDSSAQHAIESVATRMHQWAAVARALRFEAITTVYAWAPSAALPAPMLSLRCTPVTATSGTTAAPAQFAFDRGQLGGPAGLLAFVVSASQGQRTELQAQVLRQARAQLGLELQAVQTIVEKRATFACTPALARPAMEVAAGLLACGDYILGPYPATLEGAVRSGIGAALVAP